jgi:hypothetical protein
VGLQPADVQQRFGHVTPPTERQPTRCAPYLPHPNGMPSSQIPTD